MSRIDSVDAMFDWGRHLASQLGAGAVVALVGDLGAGKTHAVKGIASGIGSADLVSSPTFTLVHEYAGGRLPIYHFDFYRLGAAAEAVSLGWDDYLESGGVVVVEWADRFPELIPAHALWFQLSIESSGSRLIKKLRGDECPPRAGRESSPGAP